MRTETSAKRTGVSINESNTMVQVIQGIQNGPYGNIFNPENFFVGSQGSGAANNWAAGYTAGDTIQEEVFDMIDREADGSDSLEVGNRYPDCSEDGF